MLESSNRFLSNYRQMQQQISIKKHYQQSANHPKRFSRTDVLSHFPFMDEFGGVDEVFQETPEKVSALSLDEINLRHYIEKIFNEYKVGPKGMRASDIPSALHVRICCHHFSHILDLKSSK